MSKAQIYFIISLLFAMVVAVFAIQNTEQISINFLFWQFSEISKVFVILASATVGAMLVVFLGLWWQLKRFIHIRHLEGEIKELKNKPLQAPGEQTTINKEEEALPNKTVD